MTNFGDMLTMLANNARFSTEQLDSLRRLGNETEQRNSQVAGYTYQEGGLKIESVFNLIFSETFTVDRASVSVQIPQDYKHLMIFSNGRTTTTGSGTEISLLMKYNGTTANVYTTQNFKAFSSTTSAALATSASGAIGSFLAQNDEAASIGSSAVCYIPNYRSPFYKDSLCFSSAIVGGGMGIVVVSSTWANTSEIQSIQFVPASGNLMATSSITVYGLN